MELPLNENENPKHYYYEYDTDSEEEDYPTKYGHSSPASQFPSKDKIFNKLSRNFEKQLKIAFGGTSKAPSVPINLDQIYYARTPLESTIKSSAMFSFPSHGTSYSGSQPRKPTPIPTDDDGSSPCNGVYIEKLPEVQEIQNFVSPYQSFWSHYFVLTLRPLTKTIGINFQGVHKFVTELDNLIEEYFGDVPVTKLFAKDCPTGMQNSLQTSKKKCRQSTSNLKIGVNRLREVPVQQQSEQDHQPTSTQMLTYSYTYWKHRLIFDEQDHAILLVPNFTKQGFDTFNSKDTFEFPFNVQFQVDGQILQHSFNLPLKFKAQPQRMRLQFVVDAPGLTKVPVPLSCRISPESPSLIIFSHFMVYSVMPEMPAPSISASLNVLEAHNHKGKPLVDLEQSQHETERLVKTVLNNAANQRYLNTGKRLRWNSVHVEALEHEGYAIGYNYLYSIKPKPNPDYWRHGQSRKSGKRQQLKETIRRDLEECLTPFFD